MSGSREASTDHEVTFHFFNALPLDRLGLLVDAPRVRPAVRPYEQPLWVSGDGAYEVIVDPRKFGTSMLANPPSAAVRPRLTPVGSWRWPGGGTISFAAGGNVATDQDPAAGSWQWLDEHRFEIRWKHAYSLWQARHRTSEIGPRL